MIIGLGSDIVDIRRVERALERFGEKFEERVFTPVERNKARSRRGSTNRNNVATTYAKRFAAKEACSKALGTGFSQGVYHKDMWVVNQPSGKPTLQLVGGAARALERLLQPGQSATISVTLTDEYPYAFSLVIIEAA